MLLCALGVLAVSAAFGPKFLDSTRSDLSVPDGTPSGAATRALDRLYPDFGGWPPAFVVHNSYEPGGVLGAAAGGASALAAERLVNFSKAYDDVVANIVGYWELAAGGPDLELLVSPALRLDACWLRGLRARVECKRMGQDCAS